METLKNILLSEIQNFEQSDLIQLNNIYAREIQNDFDCEVFENDNDTMNMFFEGKEPIYILQRAFYGDYRPGDNLVTFNGYGNLESFNSFDIDDLCELPETMINDIIENWQEFSYLFSDHADLLYNEL